MCEIVHIIVCYYNENEVEFFIKNEVKSQNIEPLKIYIVNNGSNDAEKLLNLQKLYDNVEIIGDGSSNLGYWGALVEVFKKKPFKSEYIILSNTDISFMDNNFYKNLCDELSNVQHSVGVVAPSIFAGDSKKNLNPYMVYRPSMMQIRKLIFIYSNVFFAFGYNLLHYIKNLLPKKIIESKNKYTYMYAPHGSFMIFTPSFIEKLDLESYKAFLFGEEIFVGEICEQNNLEVRFVPILQLIHHEHTTTGIFQRGKLLQYKLDSLNFLYNFIKKG